MDEQEEQNPSVEPTAAPGPITITDPEALQGVYDGRQRVTAWAVATRNLAEWAETFEQRGGAEVYGDDALGMVYFSNQVQALLTPENRAMIARLRTDI